MRAVEAAVLARGGSVRAATRCEMDMGAGNKPKIIEQNLVLYYKTET